MSNWSLSPGNRPLTAYVGGYGYAVETLTAAGEAKTISYGSGMTETIDRNSRGQVTAITAVLGTSTLLGLTNEFEASTNNGNLKSQTVAPLGMKQSYSYDNRNRLFSATEQPSGGGAVSWSQTFGYDDFGNRWVSAQSGALPGGGPRPNGAAWFQSGAPAVVNNRVTGLVYDAAGNQLTLGGMIGVYDAENRLRTTTTGDFSYDFDAFGRRVRTVASGKTTYFVYDALGRLTAEYQAGATAGLQTRYLVQDQLGSTRLLTDGSGGVLRRSDYLPYGEEVPSGLGGRTLTGYGADGGVRQSFTGQMRDGETGLDFFGARFYSGALGRFTSADEVFADQDPSDPMSWNLLAYVRNNPLRYTDPDGRVCTKSGDNYQDDANPGPNCRMMLLGDGKAARYEVTEQGPPSDLLLAVAEGARSAEPAVNLAGAGFKTFGMFANSLLTLAVTCLAGDPDCTSEEIGFAMVPAGRLTGQLHHAISRKVARALSRHPILRNAYKARDSRFVALAKDKASHTGYQTWHRRLDDFVVSWVENNKGASTYEFEGFLRDLYSRSADLKNRFPLGLK